MKDLLIDWALWLQMRSCRPHTIKYHNQYLKNIFTNLNLRWQDFGDREKIYNGWARVWKLDISNNTKRKYLITMRLFADFLISKKFIDVNYPREMKAPRVQKALPFAMNRQCFKEVYQAIYRRWSGSLALRNKMIFDTIIYTGLRREEITKILREDVEVSKITVREGKGGKRRVIYLPAHFSDSLQEYMKQTKGDSEYLFCNHRGDQFTPNGISILFKRLSTHANMRIYPHLCRHTYASNCIIDGVDIYTLQHNLGHSEISTTSVYLYLNDEERVRQIQKLK